MSTKIFITPPGGDTAEIKIYDKCTTKQSTTDKAGAFTLTFPTFDKDILEKYPLGSDVRIIQDESVYRGWILNPARSKDGSKKTLQIDGMSYTGRTQKVLVTENYVDQKIGDIVIDLFSKYAPQYNLDSVIECDKVISIKFDDVFLFDAMEQLAKIAGYEWYVDEPVPELIDTTVKPAGWRELVDIFIWKVFYPSENLCPSKSLFPC